MFSICIYHLICIGAVAAFLNSLYNGDRISWFLWTPFVIQLGIFLAAGIQECLSLVSWRKIRGLLLSFLDGLRLLLGAEEMRLPIWNQSISLDCWSIHHSLGTSDYGSFVVLTFKASPWSHCITWEWFGRQFADSANQEPDAKSNLRVFYYLQAT